jgi:hypothetical protein
MFRNILLKLWDQLSEELARWVCGFHECGQGTSFLLLCLYNKGGDRHGKVNSRAGCQSARLLSSVLK